MPVTAKLSRKVYERLGDDVVNAIVDWFNQVDATYRGDLRELNDLNFARFDAKMGERLAELEARLEGKFERRLAQLEARIDGLVTKVEFGQLEARVDGLVSKVEFGQLQARMDGFVTKVEFEQRMAELRAYVDHRFAELETRLTHKIFYASAATFLAQLIALITLFRMFGPPH